MGTGAQHSPQEAGGHGRGGSPGTPWVGDAGAQPHSEVGGLQGVAVPGSSPQPQFTLPLLGEEGGHKQGQLTVRFWGSRLCQAPQTGQC